MAAWVFVSAAISTFSEETEVDDVGTSFSSSRTASFESVVLCGTTMES